ncbi:hypothetical protein BH10PSE11_BH10PSE11_41000 [soil metagenome]
MNKQRLILCAAAIATFSVLGTGPSLAKDYPFCKKAEAGPGDCRYDTYEQCLAAVSGTASYCQENFWLPKTDQGGRQRRSRREPAS